MQYGTVCFSVFASLVTVVFSIPIDNGLKLKPQILPQPVPGDDCQYSIADILLIIDGSSSIGEESFSSLRAELTDFINLMPNGTLFGAVQFSGTPKLEFNFNTYGFNKDAVAQHFTNMRYKTGTTKTAAAMQFAIDEVLPVEAGNRPDIFDLAIVITDGASQDEPKEVAAKMRANGVKIFAIGVTDQVNDQQLLDISGSPEYTFKIDDYDALETAFVKILTANIQFVCKPAVNPEPKFGEPGIEIACDASSIGMSSETEKPFEGQVYIKGHFSDPECNVQGDGTQSLAALTIPFDKCGTTRRRSQNPRGIYVENTVVFKFHPKFLTKVDRAFRVQCFYMESDKTVETLLDVSMLTTEFTLIPFLMPTCQYTLHAETPTGPLVRFALVGEKVVHKWQCDDTTSEKLFKMRVHSCFVTDGNGDQITLLGEDGCAVDRYLLNNLEYSESGMMAVVETHAFKYADRTQLYFQCQIELCVDLEGGCSNTTTCPIPARRRRRAALSTTATDENTVDVVSEAMTVVDPVTNANALSANTTPQHPHRRTSRPVCLSYMELYLFAATTFGTFLLISALFVVQHMRSSSEQQLLSIT